MPLVVFRVDAGPTIGLGHLVRCGALATAFGDAGWSCAFATTAETRDFVAASFFSADVSVSAGNSRSVRDVLGHSCDLLVVDGYHITARFEREARAWASAVLAVEDLPNRSHDCDLLLDQTLGRMPLEYAPFVSTECELLLGPTFAPLRPQFAEWRREPARERRLCRHLLVAFGGANDDLAERTVRALSPLPAEMTVDVVVSRPSPQASRVAALANDSARISVHVNPPDVAALMAVADLAIGAAGVSSWERCCLGLPAIVVVAAENQRQIAARLQEAGAAQVVEHSALADVSLLDLIAALDLQSMSRAASAICDGAGAPRVVTAANRAISARMAS